MAEKYFFDLRSFRRPSTANRSGAATLRKHFDTINHAIQFLEFVFAHDVSKAVFDHARFVFVIAKIEIASTKNRTSDRSVTRMR